MSDDRFLVEAPGNGDKLLVEIVSPEDAMLLASDQPDGGPARSLAQLPEHLLPAFHNLPSVVNALATGHVVRLVGPAHLLQGLDSGALHLVKTPTGALAMAARSSDGVIAGHLRVAEVSSAVPNALAVFQIASAITLQYYLHRINERLDGIEQLLGELITRAQNDALGQLRAAEREIRRVDALQARSVSLGEQDWLRLQSALDQVTAVFELSAANVDTFVDLVASAHEQLTGLTKGQEHWTAILALNKTLEKAHRNPVPLQPEASPVRDAVDRARAAAATHGRDVVLFAGAAQLQAQIHQRLLVASQPGGARLEAEKDAARAELTATMDRLASVAETLTLGPLSKEEASAIEARFYMRPNRMQENVSELRRVCRKLRGPVAEVVNVVSMLTDEQPYCIEFVAGPDGGVTSVMQLIGEEPGKALVSA